MASRVHSASYDKVDKLWDQSDMAQDRGWDRVHGGLWDKHGRTIAQVDGYFRDGVGFLDFELGGGRGGIMKLENDDLMFDNKWESMERAHNEAQAEDDEENSSANSDRDNSDNEHEAEGVKDIPSEGPINDDYVTKESEHSPQAKKAAPKKAAKKKAAAKKRAAKRRLRDSGGVTD